MRDFATGAASEGPSPPVAAFATVAAGRRFQVDRILVQSDDDVVEALVARSVGRDAAAQLDTNPVSGNVT